MVDAGSRATSVLLVWPRFNPNSFWSFESVCELQGARAMAPPLGLITVAALLPKTWTVKLIDRNIEEVSDADIMAADLVMTGGMLQQEPDALALVERAARLGVATCVGGPAATSTPAAYDRANFIVVGEAESVIGDLVAAWEAGERHGRFEAPKFKTDITTSPIPRFDLLNFRHYTFVNVQFSRGCPFTCEFCDIIELYGRAPRTKATVQMLAELDRLYALGYRGHVDFVDDNLIGNKKAIKLFLPHLVEWQQRHKYPFQLSTEASLNLADDADLLRMMRRANFFTVFTGIETPDEATLIHTSKKQNANRSIVDSVHRIYDSGMYVTAGFIVGFDTEEKSVAAAMSNCIRDTGIPTSMVSLLTALPNTQLARRLEKEGRLFDHFRDGTAGGGDSWSGGLNFTTRRPRRDVLQDYRDLIAEIYRPDVYFERVRQLGRRLKTPIFRVKYRPWKHIGRDLLAWARLSWTMTVRHPELARFYWPTMVECARHHPLALEGVLRNIAHFIHLYRFSHFLRATLDERLADIDAGRWTDPPALPAAVRAAPAIAAVA